MLVLISSETKHCQSVAPTVSQDSAKCHISKFVRGGKAADRMTLMHCNSGGFMFLQANKKNYLVEFRRLSLACIDVRREMLGPKPCHSCHVDAQPAQALRSLFYLTVRLSGD
jgi:hypothetical protein